MDKSGKKSNETWNGPIYQRFDWFSWRALFSRFLHASSISIDISLAVDAQKRCTKRSYHIFMAYQWIACGQNALKSCSFNEMAHTDTLMIERRRWSEENENLRVHKHYISMHSQSLRIWWFPQDFTILFQHRKRTPSKRKKARSQ